MACGVECHAGGSGAFQKARLRRPVCVGPCLELGKAMSRWMYVETQGIGRAIGLFALRLVAGTAFLWHGWANIRVPGHGMGSDSPMAVDWQMFVPVAEFAGGMFLLLGLLTPLAALTLACSTVATMATVHLPQGHPFVGRPGEPSFEMAAAYLACVVAILLLGPGVFSLDALVFGQARVSRRRRRGRRGGSELLVRHAIMRTMSDCP